MSTFSQNLTERAISATKYTIIYRSASQLMGLFVTVFLVRGLSEHDYGVYNLLYSMIALVGVFLSLGIANTLQRYIPEYYGREDYLIANKLYRVASLLRLAVNLLVIALVFLLWEQLAPLLKITEYKNYFLLFSLVVLLHLQRNILEICLNAYFLQRYSQRAAFLFTMMKFFGYGLALYYGYTLWFILVVDVLSYSVVFALLQLVYIKKVEKGEGKLKRIDKVERKRIIRYAFFYNFNDTGVGLLGSDIDNLIIALFLDPIAVGLYAFANKISKTIASFSPVNYLIDIIRPLFFYSGTRKPEGEVNGNYTLLLKITYAFHIPVLCFLILYSKEILDILFGGKFSENSWVLPSVYFFVTLNAFQLPLGLVAQLRERADIILYSKLFGIYNLLAAMLMIPLFGIVGAILATGTAVFFKNGFILYFLKKDASFAKMGPYFWRMIPYWLTVSGVGHLSAVYLHAAWSILLTGVAVFAVAFLFQFRFFHLNVAESKILVNIQHSSLRFAKMSSWLKIGAGL